MEEVQIEMVPLGDQDEDKPPPLPPKASSLIQELPSRMARHATMSGMTAKPIRRATMAISVTTELKRRAAKKIKSRALARHQEMNDVDGTFDVHHPYIDELDEDLAPCILGSIDFKAVPLPMSQRKRFRDSMRLQGMAHVSRWKNFKNKVISSWKRFHSGCREILYSLQLWRGHLKEVEGQFGSGVVSYFNFLRWLVFLNLFIFLLELGFVVIPTVVICSTNPRINNSFNNSGCTYVKPKVISNVTESRTGTGNDVLNFFIGEGWMRSTLIFYSNYPSEELISAEGVKYNLPLAFLLAGGAYFVVSFFLMITNLMSNLKESYIESEGVFNSYSNKLFAAWDYCISENKSAEHKHKIIVQQINYDISEQERKKRILQRTAREKAFLYTARTVINLIVVPAVWYATFVMAFQAILHQELDFTEEGQSKVEQLLVRYGYDLLIALAITLPNLVLPLLFEFLSIFEDWSPDTELALNLWRRVFVKLPPVAVLMFLQFSKINENVKKLQERGKPACESCWENDISSQMYMLVWVDFVVVLITTLGIETLRKVFFHRFRCFRKIGMQQFDIPRNVLDLVYGQCLILIGTFFSPLLPSMGVIKLVILFYVKKVSLMYNNTLPDRPYQGAKSNYTFTLLLLFCFFMCTAIVGWAVTNVPPSSCGPFNNVACDTSASIFEKLSAEISSWPTLIDQAVYYTSTAAFILPVLILFVVCLHHYRSVAKAHHQVIVLLKDHLAYEAKLRRSLMMKLEQSNTEKHDCADHGTSK